MFPRTLLTVSLLAGLFTVTATQADESCGSCKSAKQPSYTYCRGCLKKDRPPYVHPDTPFGYYPTVWMPWPGTCTGSGFGRTIAPPLAPPLAAPQEPEPLPPPRPAETKAPPVQDDAPGVLAPAIK